MAKAYLSLGTNLGDKNRNLRQAIDLINERIGEVASLSAFYETAPWGFSSDNSFLNAALCVCTELEPFSLLEATQRIEQEMGRTAKTGSQGYSDRIIDIDILLYDDLVMDADGLVIPHPLMKERPFVMEPLAEIAPEVVRRILSL